MESLEAWCQLRGLEICQKPMGFGGGKIEVAGLMLCEFVCWFPVSGDGD